MSSSNQEWLITNGMGGFANATVDQTPYRAHGGYLNLSLNPPADRKSVLNGVSERALSGESERKVIQTGFDMDAVPTYHYEVGNAKIDKTIVMEYGENITYVCYEIVTADEPVTWCMTPRFTWRDLGERATREDLCFHTGYMAQELCLKQGSRRIYMLVSEGRLVQKEDAIRGGIVYPFDAENGSPSEDFEFCPTEVEIKVEANTKRQIWLQFGAWDTKFDTDFAGEFPLRNGFDAIRSARARKQYLIAQAGANTDIEKRLTEGADKFIVYRKSTGKKTILAGYPWFLDWGRDTMIAFRGLVLCTKRYEDAKEILDSFTKYVKHGILPNCFPANDKEEPMYNTIDASLWYIMAVYDYYQAVTNDGQPKQENLLYIKTHLYPVMKQIMLAYKIGTINNIVMQKDGLIHGGKDLMQLTWMDVRVGDWVATPRHGKPVEINALWYNCLRVMAFFEKGFGNDTNQLDMLADKVQKSFVEKFWNEKKKCLYDVVDVEGNPGENDDSIRPNQMYAVSLPFSILPHEKELAVMECIYKKLYVPLGLRSLDPEDENYHGRYIGTLNDRDHAYHMGTAWCYQGATFIQAWLKVHGNQKQAVHEAELMLSYYEGFLRRDCIDGISEIVDGDSSKDAKSRGCYTQAWSIGELFYAYKFLQNAKRETNC